MSEIITNNGWEFSASKAVNTDLFAADLAMSDGKEFDYWEIFVHLTVSKLLKYTLDGTNYKFFNAAAALAANSGYRFILPAKIDDAFNIQHVSGTATGYVGMIRGIKGKLPA